MSKYSRNRDGYRPRDEYYTPAHLFKTLGLLFDLDPAHPTTATHVPTQHYYTKEDDGLTQPWFGLVWMNPPFSESGKWVKRFIEHGNGVALLPFSKSQWFSDIWEKAGGIVPLPFNLRFEVPSSEPDLDGKIFMPVALFGIGDTATRALTNFGRVR